MFLLRIQQDFLLCPSSATAMTMTTTTTCPNQPTDQPSDRHEGELFSKKLNSTGTTRLLGRILSLFLRRREKIHPPWMSLPCCSAEISGTHFYIEINKILFRNKMLSLEQLYRRVELGFQLIPENARRDTTSPSHQNLRCGAVERSR